MCVYVFVCVCMCVCLCVYVLTCSFVCNVRVTVSQSVMFVNHLMVIYLQIIEAIRENKYFIIITIIINNVVAAAAAAAAVYALINAFLS